MSKTILILVDGMRPDGLTECENKFTDELLKNPHTLAASTVMPSVTLPCHMSLFHSVPPERHGTLTNIYTPQVRPVNGLFEVLKNSGLKCASFYNWEELRDLSRPGCLHHSFCISYENPNDRLVSDRTLTDKAIAYIKEENPDFLFLYLGVTDADGHDFGWMGKEYLNAVSTAVDCIKSVMENFCEKYNIIITADHGGHDRIHGTALPEDMKIPLIISPCDKSAEFNLENASIMDIAPTVADFAQISPDSVWEGKSLIKDGNSN